VTKHHYNPLKLKGKRLKEFFSLLREGRENGFQDGFFRGLVRGGLYGMMISRKYLELTSFDDPADFIAKLPPEEKALMVKAFKVGAGEFGLDMRNLNPENDLTFAD
jgi:hypothetical protein